MVTAAPQVQWRLLDVQDHDTKLSQLAHRGRTLPEHQVITRLTARAREVADALVGARTLLADIGRELAKAEADVDVVRQRARRDRERLDAGVGSAKDLQAMQHELVTLDERQARLEDVELSIMERLEAAEAEVADVEARGREVDAELAEAIARRDEQLSALEAEAAGERAARADAVAGLPADLVMLYEKVREQSGGTGAARLRARRCEGCHMELNSTDIARFREAADDTVLRCEECRVILVRTLESGL